MKLSLFWLMLDEFCSYSTNFKQTHQNRRKLGEIRRNSTNYILYKSMLIGVQGKILRKFSFLAFDSQIESIRIPLCCYLHLLQISFYIKIECSRSVGMAQYLLYAFNVRAVLQ